MNWKPEIEELSYRKKLASRMGGQEGIERQRKRGKLTVRTDKLAAAQTFPIGGAVSYDTGLLEDAGAAATTQAIGTVIANNVATDGTIDVELDL